jgi:hypothetical protein
MPSAGGIRPLGRPGHRWQALIHTNINPLEPKLVYIILMSSVRTGKKTPHFTVTESNRLTLFKEIISVYSENHTKPVNTKCRVTDC